VVKLQLLLQPAPTGAVLYRQDAAVRMEANAHLGVAVERYVALANRLLVDPLDFSFIGELIQEIFPLNLGSASHRSNNSPAALRPIAVQARALTDGVPVRPDRAS
jgi:hypothetical protein